MKLKNKYFTRDPDTTHTGRGGGGLVVAVSGVESPTSHAHYNKTKRRQKASKKTATSLCFWGKVNLERWLVASFQLPCTTTQTSNKHPNVPEQRRSKTYHVWAAGRRWLPPKALWMLNFWMPRIPCRVANPPSGTCNSKKQNKKRGRGGRGRNNIQCSASAKTLTFQTNRQDERHPAWPTQHPQQ